MHVLWAAGSGTISPKAELATTTTHAATQQFVGYFFLFINLKEVGSAATK